ncbi:MAG: hypothetical protein IPK11_13930 [Ignavibacteria bacterium]|nr:hypothetical protein [Ignavibacteria bacterium]
MVKGVFFIKSEIDPTGGTNYTISGIQQLLSVPYAIYAREAREVHLPLAKESNSKISMSIATSYSEGDGAIGIIGAATNPLNFNIGVQGIANGRSTFSAGVDGRNCYVGVRGIADIADIVPEQPSYGVIGQSISSKERSAGVFGRGLMGLLAESRDTSQKQSKYWKQVMDILKYRGNTCRICAYGLCDESKNGTYTTELTYPGMQESDLIFITRSKTSANASSYSVSYINGKWNIINEDQNKALSLGDQFNVLIIKR